MKIVIEDLWGAMERPFMLDQVEMESMSELTLPSDMGIMWLEWEERASLAIGVFICIAKVIWFIMLGEVG